MAKIPPGKRHDPALVLDSLIRIGQPFIVKFIALNNCVLITRIAIDVLGDFGIAASPLTVHVVGHNAAYDRLVRNLGSPTDPEAFRRLCNEHVASTFRVGGGGEDGPNDWPHHLVAIVEGRQLLDLSIGQASSAERGIELSPILARCDEDFLAGRCELEHTTKMSGCYLKYEALLDETSYRPTWGWKSSPAHIFNSVVKRMQDDLAD